MVTGSSVTYIAGTGGRPIPRATDQRIRPAHTPQPKPKPGLDWDAITPTCDGCGQKSGQLGDGDLCPTCRGVQPTTGKKTRRDGYKSLELPEAELLRRFTAPDSPADEPTVVPSAAEHEDEVQRAGVELVVEDTAPDNVTALPAIFTPEANLDAQIAHAERVLRATYATTEPAARLLRLNAITAIEALHLYSELHLTPAPATSTPAGAGHTPVEPNPPGLGGASRSAARPLGEGDARPTATSGFQIFEKPPRKRRGTRGDIDEQAVIAEYQAGDSAPAIATRHGVRAKRIRDILDRNGIERRDDRKTRSGGGNKLDVTPELVETIRSLYVDQELTIAAIATKLGHGRHTITGVLRDHAGVKIRPAAHIAGATVLTDQQRADLVAAYLAGVPSTDLGQQYRLRPENVRRIVTEAGHQIRSRGGQNNIAQVTCLAELGATAADVRAWALKQGLVDRIRKGRVPRAIQDAYIAAHTPAPTTGDTTP